MFDAIGKIGRLAALRDQLQVVDALADGDAKLMGVNDSSKRNAGSLSRRGFDKQIFIPRE